MLGLPLTRALVDVHQTAGLNRRNIIYRNTRIWVEKKPIVSVTYENERISTKNSLPYIKCVLRLSCVVHGPIYVRLMDCTVNGTVNGLLYLKKKSALGLKRREKATAGNSFMKSCSLRSCPLPIIPLCLSREGFFPLEPKKQRSKKKTITTSDLRLEIMGYDLPQWLAGLRVLVGWEQAAIYPAMGITGLGASPLPTKLPTGTTLGLTLG